MDYNEARSRLEQIKKHEDVEERAKGVVPLASLMPRHRDEAVENDLSWLRLRLLVGEGEELWLDVQAEVKRRREQGMTDTNAVKSVSDDIISGRWVL